GGDDVLDVEALPEAAQRGGRGCIGPEVHRLAATLDHQIGQLGRGSAGADEARPAGGAPEGPGGGRAPPGAGPGRGEDAVDDEELVDAVLVEQLAHLGGHERGVARPYAASLDDGVCAVGALEVTAPLRLQVGHAAAFEVALGVDPAAVGAEAVDGRQP